MDNIFRRIYVALFGCKCPHCHERGSMKYGSGRYTRGWNNLCEQATGDSGWYCMNCGKLTWKQSYEAYVKRLPEWCTAYKDSRNHRYFPDWSPTQ